MKASGVQIGRSRRTPRDNAFQNETHLTLQRNSATALAAIVLICPTYAFAQSNGKNGDVTINAITPGSGECNGTLNSPIAVPPEGAPSNPGNVDVQTGEFSYSNVDLQIGGENGIKFVRGFSRGENGAIGSNPKIGGFSHNFDIKINEKRVKNCWALKPAHYDYVVSVLAGARSKTFRSGPDPVPANGDEMGDFVAISGGVYTWLDFTYVINADGYISPRKYKYYSGDGASISFRSVGAGFTGGGDNCGTKCAYAEYVTEPDGTNYTLSYDLSPSGGAVRLRSVVSSRGYALLFEHIASGSTISKVCALNLAQTPLPAISGETICPAGARSVTYTYNGANLSSFVDQSGVATLIGPKASTLYRPGESSPYLTTTFTGASSYKVASQAFSDGRTFTYSWISGGSYGASSPNQLGGSYTDNLGRTVTVEYSEYQAVSYDQTRYVSHGPTKVIDELGRTSTYRYCPVVGGTYCLPSVQLEATSPEGNKRQYAYDDRNRLIGTTTFPKPGSTLAPLQTSTVYGCNNWLCQNKPTAVTDPGNHTTEYAYDPVHGQLIRETSPAADANSPNPVKRIAYAQRFAWIRTAGGGYAKAATSVWVKSEERACRTSATVANACADGAADEVVTAYDYGPDAGPNNLLLRGMTVTADGQTLRTCYGYDVNGNRISETKPNANLAVCP